MSRAHENLILDTRLHQLEFTGSKTTELTTYVIAESRHAQCDADGKGYLL